MQQLTHLEHLGRRIYLRDHVIAQTIDQQHQRNQLAAMLNLGVSTSETINWQFENNNGGSTRGKGS